MCNLLNDSFKSSIYGIRYGKFIQKSFKRYISKTSRTIFIRLKLCYFVVITSKSFFKTNMIKTIKYEASKKKNRFIFSEF